jgi:hypothetical protein
VNHLIEYFIRFENYWELNQSFYNAQNMPPHKKFKNNFYCFFFLVVLFCSFFLN